MNKDINYTLMALVPLLRLNHENIKSIEAVEDWYKVGDREYKKEVAEITYDDGYMMYVDIGCDSNLTACYDILAVIQCIKPKSARIEKIKRGIYEMPEQQEVAFQEASFMAKARDAWIRQYGETPEEFVARKTREMEEVADD